MHLALVNDLGKHMLNRSPDERTQCHKLPVDAMQNRLQVIPFTRIFGVEEFEEIQGEVGIDESLCDLGVDVAGDRESEEEFVDLGDEGIVSSSSFSVSRSPATSAPIQIPPLRRQQRARTHRGRISFRLLLFGQADWFRWLPVGSVESTSFPRR